MHNINTSFKLTVASSYRLQWIAVTCCDLLELLCSGKTIAPLYKLQIARELRVLDVEASRVDVGRLCSYPGALCLFHAIEVGII